MKFQMSVPRFGCREIAFMTEGAQPSAKQQQMLREMLKDNRNSLKEQSRFRPHAHRDGVKVPMHEEDLLKDPQDGCPHGWGFAAYTPQQPDTVEIQKGLDPAFSDPNFDTAAEAMVQKSPQTLLAHIMHKIHKNRVLATVEDTHPFSFKNWSGMFNGIQSSGRSPKILEALQNTFLPALGATPKGTNSGEKLLLTFLGRLQHQFGTIDSKTLKLPDVQRAFAETMQDFMQNSQPFLQDLDASVLGLKGKIQWGPSANYIVTDGNVLMAYRKGRKLYLNRHKGTSGKMGYLVASEPIHPRGQKLQWVELPQEHILTLAKQPGGNIDATLIPASIAIEANKSPI